MKADSNPDGKSDGQPDMPPDPVASTTIGIGSMLGLGCIATVIVLVLFALAIRWFAGGW